MTPSNPSFPTLRSALACLLAEGEMGKSELQKLVYLVERESILQTGKLMPGFRFRHDKFGMFSPDLANALTTLEQEGFLTARQVKSDVGEGRKYRLAPGVATEGDTAMKGLCQSLLSTRGRGGLSGLIAYAKSTDPFITTPRDEWIDWPGFIAEQCGGTHILLPEAEEDLRRAISKKPARVLSRDAAVKELESAG
jgi:hypothetical protein